MLTLGNAFCHPLLAPIQEHCSAKGPLPSVRNEARGKTSLPVGVLLSPCTPPIQTLSARPPKQTERNEGFRDILLSIGNAFCPLCTSCRIQTCIAQQGPLHQWRSSEEHYFKRGNAFCHPPAPRLSLTFRHCSDLCIGERNEASENIL
jgi:hypothetical protein